MRTKRLTLLATAAVLALGAAPAAFAQDLRALYEAARAYDATFLAAQAQARSAEFKAAQADALTRPSAALSAGANAGYVNADGRPGGDSNTLSTTLQGRYPLFNRSNTATIAQAQQALRLSAAELAAAEQDLIVRVAQAYFDVLAAQDTLATVRAAKAATAEQLASAKRAFEVGTATITDTREAQSRFDLDVAREIAADNDLRAKRIALDQLVGRSNVEPKPLSLPATLPPVLPADPEAWVGTADAQHPTIQRAQAALEIARLEIDRAKAAEGPTLDAVASVGAAKYMGKYPQGTPGSPTTTATIGVQFNLPLYTGGATRNRISETLALEDKARNDLDAARRGVAQGTRVSYFGVQSGTAQVKALEAAESSAKLALEATQLGYKVGVRVNLDVLNAQSQLFQTQSSLASARYNVLVGNLRLRQAAGQLSVGDIDAVNALLSK
ncbi:MAG: TolC family outer membrane protein [Burkholderiaceae bacterium]|nr:TolC family outer membrane protein [Rhodoferax sp.]MCP5283662.1 TolC family outer membrane protein [Burkholderiaceae bacterium]